MTVDKSTTKDPRTNEGIKMLMAMMHMILPRVENPLDNFRRSLLKVLVSTIDSNPLFAVLEEAVPCLCILCEKIFKDPTTLGKLTWTMFTTLIKVLKNEVDERTGKPFATLLIGRYMFIIGLIVKYFDIDGNL